MNGFEAYPMFLTHPDGGEEIARDATAEKALMARGFERPGTANPAAFIRAQDQPGEPVPHEEWPKMVNGQVMQDPDAPPPPKVDEYPKLVGGKLIRSEDDEIAMLMEAAEEARIPVAERADERESLMKAATEKGLRVDGRWSLARLRSVVGGASV